MKKILFYFLNFGLVPLLFPQYFQWQQAQNFNLHNFTHDAASDANGNVYAVGSTANGSGGFASFYFVKYNANGVQQWADTAGPIKSIIGIEAAGNGNSYFAVGIMSGSLAIGGKVIPASSNWRCILAMYGPQGNVIWSEVMEKVNGCAITADNNGCIYLLADCASNPGDTLFFGNKKIMAYNSVLLSKFDTSGCKWVKKIADGTSGTSLKYDNNGHLYINGTYSEKYDLDGNKLKTLVPVAGYTAFDKDGYIYTGVPLTDSTINLQKFDSTSTLVWQQTLEGGPWGYPLSVIDSLGNLYCSVNYNYSDNNKGCIVRKINKNTGNVEWSHRRPDAGWNLNADGKGNVYIFGSDKWDYSVPNNGIVFKLGASTVGVTGFDKTQTLDLFPNPSNGRFTINTSGNASELKIYHVNGTCMHTEKLNNKRTEFNREISIENCTPGIYFVELRSDQSIQKRKMVVQ